MLIYGVSAFIKGRRIDLLALNKCGGRLTVRFSESGYTYIRCDLQWNSGKTEAEIILPEPLGREEVNGYVVVVSFHVERETVLVINNENMMETPFYRQGPVEHFSIPQEVRIVRFLENPPVVEIRDLMIHVLEDRIMFRKRIVFRGPLPFEDGDEAVMAALGSSAENLRRIIPLIMEAQELEVVRVSKPREEDRQLCLKFDAARP
jgi:hypothetical protein